MNDTAISIRDVTRSYGKTPVLDRLDLTVKAGSIYGFLGRNGSGKTTTIKLLAGLGRPETGEISVLGRDPWAFTAEDRQGVGYLSEKQNLPPLMKVRSLLAFCSRLYPQWDRELCEGLISRFQVPVNRRVSALSMGNQRLVGIILALAPRPAVVLLDEPAANLDPVARREFLDEVLDLIRDGDRTVFFSTHILSDVERVADEVGILAQGKLRVSESLDSLKETVKRVRFFGFPDNAPERPPQAFGWRVRDGEALGTLKLAHSGEPAALAATWKCQYEIIDLSLEDIFVDIARN